jgi:hypothetical protein
MRGRLLDVGLLAVWLATFIIVAMVHPDLANAIVAWVGAMLLGWYNTRLSRSMPQRVPMLAGPDGFLRWWVELDESP